MVMKVSLAYLVSSIQIRRKHNDISLSYLINYHQYMLLVYSNYKPIKCNWWSICSLSYLVLFINISIYLPIFRVDCVYQEKKILLMFKLVSIIPRVAWDYCLLFLKKKCWCMTHILEKPLKGVRFLKKSFPISAYILIIFKKKYLATSSLFFGIRLGIFSSWHYHQCHQKESEIQIIFPSISLSLWLHTLDAGFSVHPLVHCHQYLMCNQTRFCSLYLLNGLFECYHIYVGNKQTTFVNFKQELICPNI